VGCLAALLGFGIWFLTGLLGDWDQVSDYFGRQIFVTAVEGRGHGQGPRPFMFLEIFFRRYFPWMPLFLVASYWIFKKKYWKRPEFSLPLVASAVVIVFISCLQFKFFHYYLPVFPFLSILLAGAFRDWIVEKRVILYQFLAFAGLIVPTLLLALPIKLSPEMFPALKRFMPIIQAHGTCRDKILYIDGHQPYGSYGDYKALLGFYTNRTVLGSNCSGANTQIRKKKPAWVVVSGPHLEKCIQEEILSLFPGKVQFGNQTLLSRKLGRDQLLDLTPLAGELRAQMDCQAPPLPEDRYRK